jgi:cytochrome b
MLTWFGKTAFVLTSLAPIVLGYSVEQFKQGDFKLGWSFVGLAIVLVLICLAQIKFGIPRGNKQRLKFSEVKTADKEVLAFLLAYLLPLIQKDTIGFNANPIGAVVVLGLLFFAVFHSNAFCFNPVLAMFGYHFYEIKNESGITNLVITQRLILSKEEAMIVVHVADYIFLEVEDKDETPNEEEKK